MSKLFYIKCKITNDEKRCKFSVKDDLDTLLHFKEKLAERLAFKLENDENEEEELEPVEENEEEPNNNNEIIISAEEIIISYSIHGDGRHVIIETDQELLDIIEFNNDEEEEEVKIKEFIVRSTTDERFCNAVPDEKHASALKSQVMKLSMNNIPYKFSGKKEENIYYFIYHMLGYCKNNGLSTDIIIQLLLNGTLLKGDAFNFIELERIKIAALDECNDDVKLEDILDLLRVQFRCENLIIKLKNGIKELTQTKGELIKDYIQRCNKIFNKLTLEVSIQKENGCEYKDLNGIERADACMKGMNKEIRNQVLDKALDKYNKVQINYGQLKELLINIETKELYLKSLYDTPNKQTINDIHQIDAASPSKGQLKSHIEELKEEINFIKLGNQRLYGRGRGAGGYGGRGGYRGRGGYGNNGRGGYGNNGNKGKYTIEEKKKNGPCKFKKECKFGISCKNWHDSAERKYFWENRIGLNRSGGTPGRGGSNFGRFINRNRPYKPNNGNGHTINAITEKEERRPTQGGDVNLADF